MLAPVLGHYCDLTVQLAPIVGMDEGRGGKKRIIPNNGREVPDENSTVQISLYKII